MNDTVSIEVPTALPKILEPVASWICDDIKIDVRFFAKDVDSGQGELVYATVHLGWKFPGEDSHFQTKIDNYSVGQYQQRNVTKDNAIQFLDALLSGRVTVFGDHYTLSADPGRQIHIDYGDRFRWESYAQVDIESQTPLLLSKATLSKFDNSVRVADIPFDGLQDVFAWLGFPDPMLSGASPHIRLYLTPPVDFDSMSSTLRDEKLTVSFTANPFFDVTDIDLAVRLIPTKTLADRKQIASFIQWSDAGSKEREGGLTLPTGDSEQALLMLSAGGITCRRHWFTDPSKARNVRLLAACLFDPELDQMKSCLFPKKIKGGSSGTNLEKAVGMLLHILGFNAAINCETEAPDLTFVAPSGAVAIVECTLQSHDIPAKAAKLQDRRVALEQAMKTNNHTPQLLSVLVCPKDATRMDVESAGLDKKRVVLLTKANLDSLLFQLRFPPEPDAIYNWLMAMVPVSRQSLPQAGTH